MAARQLEVRQCILDGTKFWPVLILVLASGVFISYQEQTHRLPRLRCELLLNYLYNQHIMYWLFCMYWYCYWECTKCCAVKQTGSTAQAREVDNNTENRPETVKHDRREEGLSVFLMHIHSHETVFKRSKQELSDITEAVESTMRRLVRSMGAVDKRFHVKELRRNGSVFDGTKVVEPDEYDFLAVVESLSLKRTVKITRRCCQCNPGYAHVTLENNEKEAFGKMCSRTGVLCAVSGKARRACASFRDTFRRHFHCVVEREVNGRYSVRMRTGELVLEGYSVSVHGPECAVEVVWIPKGATGSRLGIHVDLCPAIQGTHVSEILQERDTRFSAVHDTMVEAEHFYLIPSEAKSCPYCFKLVFPDSDQSLVVSMSANHKELFRIFKLLMTMALKEDFVLRKVFSTFALKMLVLEHEQTCKSSENIGECAIEILSDFVKKLKSKKPCMPSVFISRHNIWRTVDKSKPMDKQATERATQIIEAVLMDFKKLQSSDWSWSEFTTYWKRLKAICQSQGREASHDACTGASTQSHKRSQLKADAIQKHQRGVMPRRL